jgi:hypothetical protein
VIQALEYYTGSSPTQQDAKFMHDTPTALSPDQGEAPDAIPEDRSPPGSPKKVPPPPVKLPPAVVCGSGYRATQ